MKHKNTIHLIKAALFCLAVHSSPATDFTFVAGGSWGSASTWAGGTAGSIPGADDNVVGATSSSTLTLNGARSVHNFTYGGSAGWVVGGSAGSLDISGTLTMNGTGALTFRPTTTGVSQTYTVGDVLVSSGTFSMGSASYTAPLMTVSGQTTVSGGLLRNYGDAASNYGVLNVTSGTFTTFQSVSTTGLEGTGTGLVNAGSGALQLTIGGTGSCSTGVTLANGAGTLSVLKNGSGSQELKGVNTYTGTTTVAAGTLIIATEGFLSNSTVDVTGGTFVASGTIGSAGVTIGEGGTLQGNGTIGGTTIIRGAHKPGNSPGVQTFTDLVYEGGTATVGWELASNTATQTPSAVFDQIVVAGDLDISEATAFSLSFDGAGSEVSWESTFWDVDQSWTIYSVSGSTTGFENLVLSVEDWQDAGGLSFQDYLAGSSFSLSLSGHDILLHYTAVPEPGAWSLVVLSALFLRWRAARRRA